MSIIKNEYYNKLGIRRVINCASYLTMLGGSIMPKGVINAMEKASEWFVDMKELNMAAGEVIAELDIKPDLWFFKCHFKDDPVMPGCLGLDAMWQLLGFYLGWLGQPGKGRALGVGEVKFTGQVLKNVKKVTYHISLKRLILRKLILGIADGILKADGKPIYEVKDMKVGLFTSNQ